MFLLANISIKIVLKMFFCIFNNKNIYFGKKKLIQRFFITAKILTTIKQVEFINKKKFTFMTLDKNIETFIIYIFLLSLIYLCNWLNSVIHY